VEDAPGRANKRKRVRWRRTDSVAWRGGSKIRGARRAEQARQGSAIAACERIRPARADTPVRARSSVLVAIGDGWTSPGPGGGAMHLPPAFLLHAAVSSSSKLGPGRWREARRGTATCSVDPGCRCRDGLGSTWRRRACPGQRFRALPAILGGAASALCGPPWCRCRTAGTRPCARHAPRSPWRGGHTRRRRDTDAVSAAPNRNSLCRPPVCGKAVLASGPAGALSLF